jgi:hypothetical protein
MRSNRMGPPKLSRNSAALIRLKSSNSETSVGCPHGCGAPTNSGISNVLFVQEEVSLPLSNSCDILSVPLPRVL